MAQLQSEPGSQWALAPHPAKQCSEFFIMRFTVFGDCMVKTWRSFALRKRLSLFNFTLKDRKFRLNMASVSHENVSLAIEESAWLSRA